MTKLLNIFRNRPQKTAQILALLVFWQPVFCEMAIAGHDFIYLAAPPKGYTKYLLKTTPKTSKLQIVGSIKPISLLVNGESLKPSRTSVSSLKRLDINSGAKSYPIIGSTFFFEYDLLENLNELVIELHDGNSSYTYKIKTSGLYLDYPFQTHKIIPTTQDSNKVEFDLNGEYLSSEKVLIKDAVSIRAKNKLKIKKVFNVGENYLIGSIGQKIINLPVMIEKINFNENALQVNLLRKDYNQFPRANGFVEGYVNFPDSTILSIDGNRVSISDDGKFEYEFFPKNEKSIVRIMAKQIRNEKSSEFTYELKINVPNFNNGNPWYYPEVQTEIHYFDIGLMETYNLKHRDLGVNDTQDRFKLDFTLGKMLTPKKALGVTFEKRDPYSIRSGQKSIQYINDVKFGFNMTSYYNWGWLYGGGLIFQNLRGEIADFDCNFCKNVEHTGLISSVFFGRRFYLRDRLELYSNLEANIPLTRMPYDFILKIKFINFRMKY